MKNTASVAVIFEGGHECAGGGSFVRDPDHGLLSRIINLDLPYTR
jgi:hypothetical protein